MHEDLLEAADGTSPFNRPKKWSTLASLCPETGTADWLSAGRDVIEKQALPKIKSRDMDNAKKHVKRLVICS